MHISDYFNYNFIFDSHAHLNAKDFDNDRDEAIKRALDNEVGLILDVGTNIHSSNKAIANAKKYPDLVKAWVGIDPEVFTIGSELFIGHDKNDKWMEEQFNELNALIKQNKDFIVGVGETGMDHYWIQSEDIISTEKSKSLQEKLFKIHLELARENELPLTVHTRGAEEECLDIVSNFPEIVGIFHSYTADYATAIALLDIGWGLGVNGIATFKKANELRDSYKKILGKVSSDWTPNDFYRKGIFFETDCPFLSPEGKRGMRNEPSNIKDIYQQFLQFLYK